MRVLVGVREEMVFVAVLVDVYVLVGGTFVGV